MRRETFAPDCAGLVRRLDAEIGDRELDDPVSRVVGVAWQTRRQTIRTVLARAEELGQRFARTAPALVLCHADAHTNNVLLDDADQEVRIVDWDETMLAPRERDLMFLMGGGIGRRHAGPREEALFFRGYGAVGVDPLGLAYYKHAWAVSDIGAYGEQVLLRPDLGPITRRESVDRFLSMFAPGNIVSLALGITEHV
jgi:spectinomycin phosphotransferase